MHAKSMLAEPAVAPPDPVPSIVRAYRPVEDEVDTWLEPLEGAVPPGLRGVLYRNGAGKVEVEGVQQMHPFDGDGMVSRFQIGPQGVHYRNRYVRTREYLAERRAGTMLFRAFGTNVPGGLRANLLRMRFKNAANTSVVWHGGRLLALWEAGQPHALDSTSLATLGRFDFGGALTQRFPGSVFNPELPFSAHPTVCPRTGELFNFGLFFGPTPTLVLYRAPAAGDQLEIRRHPLARSSFMHDFAVTERHVVLFASPVQFDVARTLAGLTTPVEAIRRDPAERTQVLVAPREGGPVRVFDAPTGFFAFHFFGAFEDAGRIVVHGCRMPDFQGGTIDLRDAEAIRHANFEPATPCRWTVDLASGEVREELFETPAMELPTIDPRRTTLRQRVGWATVRTPTHRPVYTGLGRVDLDTGAATTRDFGKDLPGEPIFVPRGADAPEGDGWLLSVSFRAETGKSELWILDATTLETVARFGLPHHQPPGFHGCFVPASG
jgi:all-trans-8'-apo-beta-carotenal 15,15'-oxygenase